MTWVNPQATVQAQRLARQALFRGIGNCRAPYSDELPFLVRVIAAQDLRRRLREHVSKKTSKALERVKGTAPGR